jgi:hypothetical protein
MRPRPELGTRTTATAIARRLGGCFGQGLHSCRGVGGEGRGCLVVLHRGLSRAVGFCHQPDRVQRFFALRVVRGTVCRWGQQIGLPQNRCFFGLHHAWQAVGVALVFLRLLLFVIVGLPWLGRWWALCSGSPVLGGLPATAAKQASQEARRRQIGGRCHRLDKGVWELATARRTACENCQRSVCGEGRRLLPARQHQPAKGFPPGPKGRDASHPAVVSGRSRRWSER